MSERSPFMPLPFIKNDYHAPDDPYYQDVYRDNGFFFDLHVEGILLNQLLGEEGHIPVHSPDRQREFQKNFFQNWIQAGATTQSVAWVSPEKQSGHAERRMR